MIKRCAVQASALDTSRGGAVGASHSGLAFHWGTTVKLRFDASPAAYAYIDRRLLETEGARLDYQASGFEATFEILLADLDR
jgi:hypothetical protein